MGFPPFMLDGVEPSEGISSEAPYASIVRDGLVCLTSQNEVEPRQTDLEGRDKSVVRDG